MKKNCGTHSQKEKCGAKTDDTQQYIGGSRRQGKLFPNVGRNFLLSKSSFHVKLADCSGCENA